MRHKCIEQTNFIGGFDENFKHGIGWMTKKTQIESLRRKLSPTISKSAYK